MLTILNRFWLGVIWMGFWFFIVPVGVDMCFLDWSMKTTDFCMISSGFLEVKFFFCLSLMFLMDRLEIYVTFFLLQILYFFK